MRPRDFRRLQARWYAVAAANGFRDIETRNGEMCNEALWYPTSPSDAKGRDIPVQTLVAGRVAKIHADAEYYRSASRYLWSRAFARFAHKLADGEMLGYLLIRKVWALHCEGDGELAIAAKLDIKANRARTITGACWEEFRKWLRKAAHNDARGDQ